MKEQQLKKLEEKNNKHNGEGAGSDEEDDEDALKVDEAKVDESKQMDFAKVEKRVRTTGGGSTGTVRLALLFILFYFICFQSSKFPFLFFIVGGLRFPDFAFFSI